MYLGVFVKRTSVNFRLEGVVVEKVVIDSVDFAAPRFPRRRSNGSLDASYFLQHLVADSSFTDTGGTRYDKKETAFLLKH